jgi:prepilin-type N-terminal cleavage/methylation domain-containing protein
MTSRTWTRPQRARAAAQRGFTLLELVTCLAILSLLTGFAVDRASDNMELAEKAAVETQHLMLRSAMDLQVASLISAGRSADLAGLARRNPVEWLKQAPANYLGPVAGEPAAGGRAGYWYFDTLSAELVYVASRHAHLKPDRAGRYQVRYQVSTGPADKPGKGATFSWPLFSVVEPYQWF